MEFIVHLVMEVGGRLDVDVLLLRCLEVVWNGITAGLENAVSSEMPM